MTRGAALLLLILGPSARAADRADLGYVKGYFSDAAGILSSPARWDKTDWLEAAGLAGATGVLYFGVDVAANKAAQRNQSGAAADLAHVGQALGNGGYAVPALIGVYLGGEAAGNSRLRRVGLYGVESFALSGLFVSVLKAAAGRSRPYNGEDFGRWKGPAGSNADWSFPSGHSAAAFSVATVFAAEYEDNAVVPPVAYGLAGLTALSRIYQNQHWASDVFFGGAVGYFTAKAVLSSHGPGGRSAFVPWTDGKRAGALWVRRF